MKAITKIGKILARWDEAILAQLAAMGGPVESAKAPHVARHRATGLSTAQRVMKAQVRWQS